MADFEIPVQAGSNHLIIIFLVKLLYGFEIVQHPTAGQQYCNSKKQEDDMAYILHNSVMFN